MLSAGDIDRYHFRMTDNHAGGTFDYDVDFDSDLVIIESRVKDPVRVTNILGKAQREDIINSINRSCILGMKPRGIGQDENPVIKSDYYLNGRSYSTRMAVGCNRQIYEFTTHLLGIAQYLGMNDRNVEEWRSILSSVPSVSFRSW